MGSSIAQHTVDGWLRTVACWQGSAIAFEASWCAEDDLPAAVRQALPMAGALCISIAQLREEELHNVTLWTIRTT